MALIRQKRLPQLHLSLPVPSIAAGQRPKATFMPAPAPTLIKASTPTALSSQFRLADFDKLAVLGRGNGGTVYKVRLLPSREERVSAHEELKDAPTRHPSSERAHTLSRSRNYAARNPIPVARRPPSPTTRRCIPVTVSPDDSCTQAAVPSLQSCPLVAGVEVEQPGILWLLLIHRGNLPPSFLRTIGRRSSTPGPGCRWEQGRREDGEENTMFLHACRHHGTCCCCCRRPPLHAASVEAARKDRVITDNRPPSSLRPIGRWSSTPGPGCRWGRARPPGGRRGKYDVPPRVSPLRYLLLLPVASPTHRPR
ncbi:uncharacterized protein LOC124697239 [Lolium rigidum]|uniref:uncharacterized protein LOC124697239 n=1 Tax=Lolium rigidum TaxID=89674 RepID=UPI001F5C42FE|nr:uncharacterized protein LOC124697239 [Lolium rigidum]